MKYYITGDCHRHFERISFFCGHHATTKEDVMILLGDAGVNFFIDETDRELKHMLSELPVTFFFIHGNHEERPYNISSYRTKLWQEGLSITNWNIRTFCLPEMVKSIILEERKHL